MAVSSPATRNPEVLVIPEEPMPAAILYTVKCRTCGKNYQAGSPAGKKCAECKAKDAATPKPQRPGLTSNVPKQRKTKAAPPPDDDPDEDKPIAPKRITLACANCAHAKRNAASETGFECRKPTVNGPGAYSSCKPWTFAYHQQKVTN